MLGSLGGRLFIVLTGNSYVSAAVSGLRGVAERGGGLSKLQKYERLQSVSQFIQADVSCPA